MSTLLVQISSDEYKWGGDLPDQGLVKGKSILVPFGNLVYIRLPGTSANCFFAMLNVITMQVESSNYCHILLDFFFSRLNVTTTACRTMGHVTVHGKFCPLISPQNWPHFKI